MQAIRNEPNRSSKTHDSLAAGEQAAKQPWVAPKLHRLGIQETHTNTGNGPDGAVTTNFSAS